MFKQINKKIIILLIFILSISLSACSTGTDPSSNDSQNSSDTAEPVQIDVSFVGDIMVHMPQIENAKTDDGYSYDSNFEYVKEYISDSDLAVCNLETTFAGEPYSGYPRFSAPDELADAIKNSGFDVAVTSNNHILDKNVTGLKKTIAVLENAGLENTGTKSAPEDKGYLITTVKGIKVGIVAATYESSMIDGERTLNGNIMGDEGTQLVNSFNYQKIDEDMTEYRQNIDDARNEGAQIIIAYFHWGEEYQNEPNDKQKDIAKKAAEFGADIIFASHPHVLQEEDVININENGVSRDVPVFYSMGNFLSNQRSENMGNRHAEEGMIAQARITYDAGNSLIKDITTGYIPTWVNKYYSGDKIKYAIVPLMGDFQNNVTLTESGNTGRAEQAKSHIEEILGAPDNIFEP